MDEKVGIFGIRESSLAFEHVLQVDGLVRVGGGSEEGEEAAVEACPEDASREATE